jgi:hypothetical protein
MATSSRAGRRISTRLGRLSLAPAGPPLLLDPGWAGLASPGWAGTPPPAGPLLLVSRLGSVRLGRHPAWVPAPRTSQAGPLARVPRLGLRRRPGWAIPAFGRSSTWLPAGPPHPLLPGWAGSGGSGLAGIPSPGRYKSIPVGPVLHIPAGPGRDSLAQAGLILSRLDYTTSGWDLLPPGHIPRPASPPALCASLGTPPGSDWHILHHRMLVLGRPLAQTSISLLS